MVFCCQAMKGEILNCSTNKDIYFLETNTKTETTDLTNLFVSPAGREMFKYKARPKHKHKLNPALDFFIQTNSKPPKSGETSLKTDSCQEDVEKCIATTSTTTSSSNVSISEEEPLGSRSRRRSIDLYEEAASILGLTCSQTDDCKCLECQCHYFDFDDDIEFSSDCVMDHSSSCCIQ